MNMNPIKENAQLDLPAEPISLEDKLPSPEARNLMSSYTVDERGILNNFAIMPKMYYVEEPAPMTTEEALRSRSQMVFAIIIGILAVMVALLVSW